MQLNIECGEWAIANAASYVKRLDLEWKGIFGHWSDEPVREA
jgi:hypothetical protein